MVFEFEPSYAERLEGTLVGTAVGDALGLYVEGLSAVKIQRHFGRVDRFMMPGGIGILSDDTEQSALIAESLAAYPDDVDNFVRHFRWCLVRWFWTLPPGVGKATIQACLRLSVGLKSSGINSAGNGAAMRTAVIGTFFHQDRQRRRTFTEAAARVTHTDERSIQASLFVSELAAVCANAPMPGAQRLRCFLTALETVELQTLRDLLGKAERLATDGCSVAEAAQELGTTGFVMHTVPFATFCYLRFSEEDPIVALIESVTAGGDTDSIAAILGAWLGALYGVNGFPEELRRKIFYGPVNKHKLCLAMLDRSQSVPGFNYMFAFARNVVLIPFLLLIALTRLFY